MESNSNTTNKQINEQVLIEQELINNKRIKKLKVKSKCKINNNSNKINENDNCVVVEEIVSTIESAVGDKIGGKTRNHGNHMNIGCGDHSNHINTSADTKQTNHNSHNNMTSNTNWLQRLKTNNCLVRNIIKLFCCCSCGNSSKSNTSDITRRNRSATNTRKNTSSFFNCCCFRKTGYVEKTIIVDGSCGQSSSSNNGANNLNEQDSFTSNIIHSVTSTTGNQRITTYSTTQQQQYNQSQSTNHGNYSEYLLPQNNQQITNLNQITMIIDLDETLVHSSFKPIPNADFIIPVEIDGQVHSVYVAKRPFVDEFLRKMGELYECVLFTASLSKYADPVADLLDQWNVFSTRLFRESCVFHRGNYVKDLNRLGRNLEKVVIIDNSPASYIFHPDNAIPVTSWFEDQQDTELLYLIPFFEKLANVDNIYTVLKNSNHPFNQQLELVQHHQQQQQGVGGNGQQLLHLGGQLNLTTGQLLLQGDILHQVPKGDVLHQVKQGQGEGIRQEISQPENKEEENKNNNKNIS